ncbi:MAG: 5'-nucleotidase, lipoprotein e(P4) family [Xanthomonadaceae bacterium]|nr:5'-nucleotidase, lipoprotein e(P4) family [Xanthomonadaceae bacterium]
MSLHRTLAASLFAVTLALSACRTTAPTERAPAPALPVATVADVGAAPHDNLNAVVWMQRTAEYAAVTQTVYHAAISRLDPALKDRQWDALVPDERGNAATGLPPAVVMDVDETVLDNSPYQARLIRDGQDYNEVTWDQWVAEEKAKAVPGVVEFAKAANARGVTILYISNRATHLKDATIANLRAVGMPVKDDSVFLGLGTFVPDCEQNGSEKDCRRRLAGQQYRVVMQFGDQLGDFAQILANTPQARADLANQYRTWFGERWFMLPNPSYGSWEPALFNNAWSQPSETRRKSKLDALDIAR